jgi:hypothetical protein
MKLQLSTRSLALLEASFFLLTLAAGRVGSPVPGAQDLPHLKRADGLIRGWAMAIPTTAKCPANTFLCGESSCCPNGSWCYTTLDTNSNICCPNGPNLDCGYQVALDSRCADINWVLWKTNKDPICCLKGQKGVQPAPNEDYGTCVPSASKVPIASLATKVCTR